MCSVKYDLLRFTNTRRRSKSTHGGPDINLRTILTLQSPGSFVLLPQPPSHILHYSARISYPVVYGKCLTYSTSSAGLNLRKQCQNAHLFSPPTSHVVNQAISRVCRLGQTKIILIYEYLTNNTFQYWLHRRGIAKALPGIITELSVTTDNEQAISAHASLTRWRVIWYSWPVSR